MRFLGWLLPCALCACSSSSTTNDDLAAPSDFAVQMDLAVSPDLAPTRRELFIINNGFRQPPRLEVIDTVAGKWSRGIALAGGTDLAYRNGKLLLLDDSVPAILFLDPNTLATQSTLPLRGS